MTSSAGQQRIERSRISGRIRSVDRIVLGTALVSLLTKLHLFFAGFMVYREIPLRDPFFPEFLQNSLVYLVCYLGAILLTTIGIILDGRRAGRLVRGLLLGCLFLLCIHQQTYNDVTFMTCLWTVAWSFWLVSQDSRRGEPELLVMATTFSHLVLSMIFLGGAVGKMSPGYWNGDVLYAIYFESRNFWFFNAIREMVDEQSLPLVACWYSRFVIVMESVCALLWLMPARLASVLALATLFGVALLSNWYLFSVVACLAGLASVGLLAGRPADAAPSQAAPSR